MDHVLKPQFYRAITISFVSLFLCSIIFAALEPEWNYFDGVYFASVVLTTVGYGDLAPTNDLCRLFTIIYITLSWFLLGRVLSAAVLESIDSVTQRVESTLNTAATVISKTVTKSETRKRKMEVKVTTLATVFGGCVFGGTLLFLLAGNGLVESLFAAFSTLSTVGFGDFVLPNGTLWRIAATVYVLISTITTAWCVSSLVQVIADYKHDEFARKILKKKMTRSERYDTVVY